MDEYLIYQDTIEGIAGAIRARAGLTDPIYPTDMPSAIRNIPTGAQTHTVGISFNSSTHQYSANEDYATVSGWLADGDYVDAYYDEEIYIVNRYSDDVIQFENIERLDDGSGSMKLKVFELRRQGGPLGLNIYTAPIIYGPSSSDVGKVLTSTALAGGGYAGTWQNIPTPDQIVTITYDENTSEYSADKTFAEISDMIAAGVVPVACTDIGYLPLKGKSNTYVRFSTTRPSSSDYPYGEGDIEIQGGTFIFEYIINDDDTIEHPSPISGPTILNVPLPDEVDPQGDVGKVLTKTTTSAHGYAWQTAPVTAQLVNLTSLGSGLFSADKTYAQIQTMISSGVCPIACDSAESNITCALFSHVDDQGRLHFIARGIFDETINGTNYARRIWTRDYGCDSSDIWILIYSTSTVLPYTDLASAGQILKLDANKDLIWANESKELPAATSDDEGKVLMVDSNGHYVLGTINGV